MVTAAMVNRFHKTFVERMEDLDSGSEETVKTAIHDALESVEGNFQQDFANEQVQDGMKSGRCPVCGGDME
jgi:hypothetical protein